MYESEYILQRRKKMLGLANPEPEKKRAKIRPVAKNREKKNREYSKLRKQFLIEHPRCQVNGCNRISEQIHHQKGRIGDLLTDVRYFLAVCPEHHTEIENHPEIAKQKGYSQSRLKN